MSWHGYSEGQKVTLKEIEETCEDYIEASVDDELGKTHHLEKIKNKGREQGYLFYRPKNFGKGGWGDTPLNPNAWKTA